jgi:hypothetical protein
MKRRLKLTRANVRTFPCLQCGAEAGQSCKGSDNMPRKANHAERIRFARKASS